MCCATKLRIISRLTGAIRVVRTLASIAARPYFRGHAVAAERLDGLVDRPDARLGGGVLGHVRRLARAHVVAGVVQRRRLLHHQPGQFQLDLHLGERMRDALVRADRHIPDGTLFGVAHRLVQGVPARPDRQRRGHDPLRVQPGEQLQQRRVLVPDERVGRQPYVVQEQQELLVRRHDVHLDRPVAEAGRVGRHDEQRRLAACRSSRRPCAPRSAPRRPRRRRRCRSCGR